MQWKTEVIAEDSLMIYFFDTQGNEDLGAVEYFSTIKLSLRSSCAHHLREILPSYASLMLVFDIDISSIRQWQQRVEAVLTQPELFETQKSTATNRIEIPVYYSLQTGPDLERLAQAKGMSTQELIQCHTARDYRVYALGFTPGFPYLGFVDDAIAAERLAQPRRFVQKGSVGIADNQTGIYPILSPGGWNIIGRTPESLLRHEQSAENIALLNVGDTVRFRAIDKHEYLALGGAI